MHDKARKVSKLRVAAGVAVGTIGLSLVGSLMPAVASADPWVPYSGPLHPVRHYAADVLHPVWALTHPLRAAVPGAGVPSSTRATTRRISAASPDSACPVCSGAKSS